MALRMPMQQLYQEYQVVRPLLPTTAPVALLNEVCSKSKQLVKSDETHEGPNHHRVFHCFLTFSPNDKSNTLEVSAFGKGKQRKEAKHEAARALLLKMDPRLDYMISYNPLLPTPLGSAVPVSDVHCTGNPIGNLNNLCMKDRLPPPVYQELVDESQGTSANPTFKIACRLDQKIYGIGHGFSKKQAKREAAAKAFEKLRQEMEESATASGVFQDVDQDDICRELTSVSLKEETSNDGRVNAKPSSPRSLVKTVTSFNARKGEKLQELITLDQVEFETSDHVQILNELAMEQNFRLEFLDFLPHLDETRHNSMLSMGMDDVFLIFVGNGTNSGAARKAASFKGLAYFRLIYRYT